MNVYTTKVQTTKDIASALTQIAKIDKYKRYDEYTALCQALMQKQELLTEFFSQSPYTGKHSELAARLYLTVGKQIYFQIKSIMPTDIGKALGNWDEFMLSQIAKITYAIWHRGEMDYDYCLSIPSLLAPFLTDIESICDEALYIEMMCKIARTIEFEVDPSLRGKFNPTLDREKYVIDYEFMKSRYPNISHTNNGMHRFINLLEALADYDYLSALKAWGDFYYLFEDVYENNPPTQTSFTAAMYNTLFAVPQYKTGFGDDEFLNKCKLQLETTIHDYGWKYLHHAFEINTSTDWCLDWIYRNLPIEDKVLADQAKNEYLQEQQNIPQKVEKKKNIYDDIEDLLLVDTKVGITTWKKCLLELDAQPRLTKKAQLDAIDSIILHVSKIQDDIVVHSPFVPIVKFTTKPIFLSILSDDWLLDFYSSHFQQTGCSADIAALALILDDQPRLQRIFDGFSRNSVASITLQQFRTNIYNHIGSLAEFMLSNAEMIMCNSKNGLINKENNPDEFLIYQPTEDEDKISLIDHPRLITQLKKFIAYCKKHCLEN